MGIILDGMLILALDTTTRGGSCALAREDLVLCEAEGDPLAAQSSQLPGDLMRLLDRAGVSLREIDAYAVATGPGSFTGLRIGIATMQGLALATRRPLVGVSAFDALATIACDVHAASPDRAAAGVGVAEEPSVHTWVDAWRGEVFAARYEGGREVAPPVVAKPEALLPLMGDTDDARRAQGPTPVLFIGNGAATYRGLILATAGRRARVADPAAPALAGAIARLAWGEARAGRLPLPHAVRPVYVRRPDVELRREWP